MIIGAALMLMTFPLVQQNFHPLFYLCHQSQNDGSGVQAQLTEAILAAGSSDAITATVVANVKEEASDVSETENNNIISAAEKAPVALEEPIVAVEEKVEDVAVQPSPNLKYTADMAAPQQKQQEVMLHQHPKQPNEETPTTCLDSSGPQPYILMSLGRSGSGSTWQVIGNLTGTETPKDEYTGSDRSASKQFFNAHGDDDKWLMQYLCKKQKTYHNAKVVGFTWKPYMPVINAPAARAGLETMSKLKEPMIKVVRLRRNLLDAQISTEKHSAHKLNYYCKKGQLKCIEKHLNASIGLDLYTGNMAALFEKLDILHTSEDRVDELLLEMNIPHVQVKYERLFSVDGKGDDIEEWEKIFGFLGAGPATGLTRERLENGMQHAATHPQDHNTTLANYDEVAEALKGSKYENLLH